MTFPVANDPEEFERMNALRRRVALVVTFLCLWARFGHADSKCAGCANFPVPRAEAEFRELMEVPRGFAASGEASLEEIFLNFMPYGPLSVQISGEATHDEISHLTNYYFGAACKILGVEPSRLSVVFNCGSECVEKRRDQIKHALDAWSEVARRFRAASGVELVGAWGAPVSFRVNDILKAGENVMIAVPSKVMGFIPGGTFQPRASLAEALQERRIKVEQVESLLSSMTKAGAVAVRYRRGGGVEVILLGLADNLSGVLFLPEGQSPPETKSEHENGSSYVLVEKLRKGAYFFETR
jgi:hypothetical protein